MTPGKNRQDIICLYLPSSHHDIEMLRNPDNRLLTLAQCQNHIDGCVIWVWCVLFFEVHCSLFSENVFFILSSVTDWYPAKCKPILTLKFFHFALFSLKIANYTTTMTRICADKKSIQNKINRLHTGILLLDKNYNKSVVWNWSWCVKT